MPERARDNRARRDLEARPHARPWVPRDPGLRYALTGGTLAALLFVAYFYPHPEGSTIERMLRAYLAGYAEMVGAILAALEPSVRVQGATIVGPRFSMTIVRTCDAMEVNILLLAAVATFPMPLVRRFFAASASLLVLIVVNVLRLCSLYWLGSYAPACFERAHQVFAPLLLVGSAIVIFVLATVGRQPRAGRGTRTADGVP